LGLRMALTTGGPARARMAKKISTAEIGRDQKPHMLPSRITMDFSLNTKLPLR
jgi:hypothetical protein